MCLPKEILLEIALLAHLDWIKNNKKTLDSPLIIKERVDLRWNMWDLCEDFCRQLFRRYLECIGDGGDGTR